MAITAQSTEWFECVSPPVPITRSILPSSADVVPETFVVKIKTPNEIPTGKSFEVVHNINLQCPLLRLGRNLPNFHSGNSILLQYPVKMTKFNFLRCMKPGQRAVVTWMVFPSKSLDVGSIR